MDTNTKPNMPEDWRNNVAKMIADAEKLVKMAKKLMEDRQNLISALRKVYNAKKTRQQKQSDIPYIQAGWTRSNATLRSIEPEWKAIVAREQKILERSKKLASTHQLGEKERQLLGNMGVYSAEIYRYIGEMRAQKLPETGMK